MTKIIEIKKSEGPKEAKYNTNGFLTIGCRLLKMLGMSPFVDPKFDRYILIKIWLYFNLLNDTILVIADWRGCYENYMLLMAGTNAVEDFIEVVVVSMYCTLILLTLFVVIRNKVALKVMKDGLDNDFPKSLEKFDYYEISQHIKISKIAAKNFTIIVYVIETFFTARSIVENVYKYINIGTIGRYFPLGGHYFIDLYQYSISLYAIFFTHQILAVIHLGSGLAAVDLLCFGLIFYYCLHFQIIIQQLKDLDLSGSKESVANCERRLIEIIKYHQRLLSIEKNLNRTFALIVFLKYFVSILTICLAGLALLISGDYFTILRYLFFLSYSIIDVFAFCYLGNKLITLSNSVAEIAYNQDWTGTSILYKKLLLLLILRSQKPIVLKGILIKEVDLVLFQMILNASYRMFALLSSWI